MLKTEAVFGEPATKDCTGPKSGKTLKWNAFCALFETLHM